MGTIWIREFTGGLDTRRLPETTAGGSLIRAIDGHIGRGGEFEKRAAFIRVFDLPAGTLGLTAGTSGLITFGSGPTPAMPAGIGYQQIVGPRGELMTNLLSTTRFSGASYVVGLFDDGKRYHFYNGALVGDWFDGQGRASFKVTGADEGAADEDSVGSFEMLTYGTGQTNDTISAVSVGGVNLLTAFNYTPSANQRAGIADAIVNKINTGTATHGFTASRTNYVFTLTKPGAAANGKAITVSNIPASGTSFGNYVAMAGGTNVSPVMSDLKVDGVSVIAGPVTWTGDPETMAQAIATAVSDAALGYTAYSSGATVYIASVALEESEFGKTVEPISAQITFDPASGLTLTTGGAYTPGSFVETIGSKVYSVSGPNLHFSAIKDPTRWQADNVGAGFIDMSSEAANAEDLKAVAKYQNYIAVFAGEVTLVWYVDPDPSLNKVTQVLNNTGTVSGGSVVQFGDADLFYLDESGVRSLRARDASNAAATSDIGVPVDTLIIDKLKGLSAEQRDAIRATIEPRDGRFWLVIDDEIFVFSYFPGSKVSAWSVYRPTVIEGGAVVPLQISDIVVYKRRVYVRSGDAVYVYGGVGDELIYDETQADVWLPYLDGGTPTRAKELQAIDVACQGEWAVSIGMQPNDLDAVDHIATVTKTTFQGETIGANGRSTHFGLRFLSQGDGYARLGSAVLHYEADSDED